MKRIEEFKEKMGSETVIKNIDLYLIGFSLFLLGIVIGVFTSPKKYSVIGSNNGSYNGFLDDIEGTEEDDK